MIFLINIMCLTSGQEWGGDPSLPHSGLPPVDCPIHRSMQMSSFYSYFRGTETALCLNILPPPLYQRIGQFHPYNNFIWSSLRMSMSVPVVIATHYMSVSQHYTNFRSLQKSFIEQQRKSVSASGFVSVNIKVILSGPFLHHF